MSENTEPLLQILREPPLAYLIINRPQSRNALNAEVWRTIAIEANTLAQDEAVRVLIIRGAGDKSTGMTNSGIPKPGLAQATRTATSFGG